MTVRRVSIAGRGGYRWSVASFALALGASLVIAVTVRLAAPLLLVLLWPILVTGVAVRLGNRPNVWIYRTVAASLMFPLLPLGYGAFGALYLPSIAAMLVAAFR